MTCTFDFNTTKTGRKRAKYQQQRQKMRLYWVYLKGGIKSTFFYTNHKMTNYTYYSPFFILSLQYNGSLWKRIIFCCCCCHFILQHTRFVLQHLAMVFSVSLFFYSAKFFKLIFIEITHDPVSLPPSQRVCASTILTWYRANKNKTAFDRNKNERKRLTFQFNKINPIFKMPSTKTSNQIRKKNEKQVFLHA